MGGGRTRPAGGARASAPDGAPAGSCHERALRLLAARARTRGELRDRLLRAGYDPAEVEGELDRLERVGLLDDARFARGFAEREVGERLAGSRAVGRALAAKGVARAVIEEVVGAYAEGEEARAVELARRRAPRLAALGPEAAFRRLVSFLSRRGYDPAVALRAARIALGLAPDEASHP